jgi:hypothetical protein
VFKEWVGIGWLYLQESAQDGCACMVEQGRSRRSWTYPRNTRHTQTQRARNTSQMTHEAADTELSKKVLVTKVLHHCVQHLRNQVPGYQVPGTSSGRKQLPQIADIVFTVCIWTITRSTYQLYTWGSAYSKNAFLLMSYIDVNKNSVSVIKVLACK